MAKIISPVVVLSVLGAIGMLAWSPWVTEEYVIDKVVQELGGPDAKINYLGNEMTVRDVPKTVAWYPFVRAVYFPSEAVWFVAFYGQVV